MGRAACIALGWGKTPVDDLNEEIFYPISERLLSICDAVLRLPAESRGADNYFKQAEASGIPTIEA
ncbi:hypothetical protein [Nioella ostreopsis]|uniref:hypothetical protein n=1 Tax=Nioella ostreopsis TaxID=2448479 RepID=UPI001981CB9C|nr:hypothetical protein [Nioella ostreopsis]